MAVARVLHGRAFPDAMLHERIAYMYVIPRRYGGDALTGTIEACCPLRLEAVLPSRHASLAQPRHRIEVWRRVSG